MEWLWNSSLRSQELGMWAQRTTKTKSTIGLGDMHSYLFSYFFEAQRSGYRSLTQGF